MNKTKCLIATLLSASLIVTSAGCKPTVATMKETLGTTSDNKPVVAIEKQAETTTNTTTISTTTIEAEAESMTTSEKVEEPTTAKSDEAESVQMEQESTTLDDMRSFSESDFNNITVKMDISQGENVSVKLEGDTITYEDITYNNLKNMDIIIGGTQDSSNVGLPATLRFSMHDVESYLSGDTQYINEKGLCSMMETITDMIIQMFMSMATTTTSDGNTASGNEGAQSEIQKIIDELHNVIQNSANKNENRYIKITQDELATAMKGMSFYNTSDMMSNFNYDFTGLANAFELVKDDFCTSDGEYNVFTVDETNKDLFFDTLLEMDDATLVSSSSLIPIGNPILTSTTIVSIPDESIDTSTTSADTVRKDLTDMKNTVNDDFYYIIRTKRSDAGAIELSISTNYISSLASATDAEGNDETSATITMLGGFVNEALTLPSEEETIDFQEWNESFAEATADFTQPFGGTAE